MNKDHYIDYSDADANFYNGGIKRPISEKPPESSRFIQYNDEHKAPTGNIQEDLRVGDTISIENMQYVVVGRKYEIDRSNADANFYNGGIKKEYFTTIPLNDVNNPDARKKTWVFHDPNFDAKNMVHASKIQLVSKAVASNTTDTTSITNNNTSTTSIDNAVPKTPDTPPKAVVNEFSIIDFTKKNLKEGKVVHMNGSLHLIVNSQENNAEKSFTTVPYEYSNTDFKKETTWTLSAPGLSTNNMIAVENIRIVDEVNVDKLKVRVNAQQMHVSPTSSPSKKYS